MKLIFLYIFCLSAICISLYSQSGVLNFLYSKPIGGNSELVYSSGPYTGSSPHDFTVIDGKHLWIAQANEGIIISWADGKVINKVEYPPSDLYSAFKNGGNYFFYNNWSASINGPVITQYTNNFISILSFKHYKDIKLLWSRPYILNDRAFFFRDDGKLISFSKDGLPADLSPTISILLSWVTKSSSTSTTELLKSGKYLIVDGIYYPASCAQMVQYFQSIGNQFSEAEHFRKILGDSPPDGMSYNGDIYVRMEDGVYVYSQDGSLYAKIDTSTADPYKQSNSQGAISEFLTAVHPNGDLYAMYVRKDDKAYFYKSTRKWGIDYVSLSKMGVSALDLKDPIGITASTKRMNSHELRIIKNAFFALKGYDFESWELKCFFNGYDWYKPDPSVKSDVNLLTENQKRLYDLVVAEEARRN